MTEDDAKAWLNARYDASTVDRLEAFVDLLLLENAQQNLISPSTEEVIWSRHIVDSAQLLDVEYASDGMWFDIGSGGGLPGIVVAILRDTPITLVEPRRRRADFLQAAVDRLSLHRATVQQQKINAITEADRAATISARAVGSIDMILTDTQSITDLCTTFILPRGRSAWDDLEQARQNWHGMFHVKHSLTDPSAGILIATGVRKR